MPDNSIEYAKMIEIPHSSCEYHYKRKKRFFNKKHVIKKVNADIDSNNLNDFDNSFDYNDKNQDNCLNCDLTKPNENELKNCLNGEHLIQKTNNKKEKIKNNIITAQIIAVFALSVAIILTNVFWENSGMNQLFKSVFKNEKVEEDNRDYDDFNLNLPIKSEGVTLSNGVLSVEGEYSLYPVCEGNIKKVERNSDGTFTVTILHSNSFSSVIEGADFVYFAEGDKVSANLPVCHTLKGAKIYLYDEGSLLTDFSAIENSIVFNK